MKKRISAKPNVTRLEWKFLILFILVFNLNNISVFSQVTIGSSIPPKAGAILDLKQASPGSQNETGTKGLIYPRVILSNKNELYPMFNSTDTDYIANKSTLKKSHAGLTVYNSIESGVFVEGLYFWNGTEWRKVDDSEAIEAQITSLVCASAQMTPNTYKAGVAFEGILKIPYLGGNGGTYSGTTSESLSNGLKIERIQGKLAIGGGEVLYRISGTPTVSSPTTTTIPSINFLGYTCTNIVIGNGLNGINVRNLTSNVTINTLYSAGAASADTLPFETIDIKESGSYAFSVRLYGDIAYSGTNRLPFYIYLQKNSKSNVLDAAELDIVVVASTAYSYSITLGGVFEVGDTVIISMSRSALSTWKLYKGSSGISPVRTSLLYWKL